MVAPKLVLYVEDNAANFSLVRKVLEAGGEYRVQGADSGEEALASLERERPDLILLDLDLPGISGIEVARRMQAKPEHRSIPVIAISASVMKRERVDALGAGCLSFVEKPFDIGELRDTVTAAIDGTLERAKP